MKILVVDDSKAMRMIVRRCLRQAGFGDADVTEAADGLQGLDAVKSFAPDLILSDWNMPEMNGLEFLQALRAEGNDVRFIFVTSEGTPEMRAKAIEAGANSLLTKPLTADRFAEVLAPTS